METLEDLFILITAPEDLYKVKEALDAHAYPAQNVRFQMFPKTFISCDEETKKANSALIEWLEALDDVDEVYHNMSDE
jgi:transcriptional/translational regulatory protein YebC/TACO1